MGSSNQPRRVTRHEFEGLDSLGTELGASYSMEGNLFGAECEESAVFTIRN